MQHRNWSVIAGRPHPTAVPGTLNNAQEAGPAHKERTAVPSCRIMMPPARTAWPPHTFTPRRCEFESRPFFVLPPPFLCAASIWSGSGARRCKICGALTGCPKNAGRVDPRPNPANAVSSMLSMGTDFSGTKSCRKTVSHHDRYAPRCKIVDSCMFA